MPEDIWTSSNEARELGFEVGRRIRSFREDAGLDVPELARRTRIGFRYLQALEDGRFEELPGPVFVKGFIRSVCAELGRDPAPVMEILDRMEVEEPAEEPDTGNGPRRLAPLILSAAALVILITGGILLHGGGGSEEPAGTPPAAEGPPPLQEPGQAGDEASVPEDPVVELDLILRATERTWLRIQSDGSEPWEATMKAGDEIRLRAMERISLFIGNAGGLLFELNGRRFGPLGTQGQVISNYVITRENL